MDTIVAILRAAHCKSTHHFFAVDALDEVSSERGKALANLLLANYTDYLQGAKDPDTVFKDFENHVLHVRDGYWGGAAKTAEKWLVKSNTLLAARNWKEAAYSLGVLSHYFTDPFMPLHTAQSPRETIFHRPLEWSVCCSYQSIFKLASEDSGLESFPISSGSDWLTDGILRGATLANQFYDPIMDDYDMKESGKHPELALGLESKKSLARIFTWVLTAWGSAIDRIANESSVSIPNVSLAIPTLLAGVQMPVKKIVAALDNAQQRSEVEKILDEFQRTGNVVRNISPEQKTVSKVRKERPELRPNSVEIQRAISSELFQEQIASQKPKPVAAKPAVAPQPQVSTRQNVVSTPKVMQPAVPIPPKAPVLVRENAIAKMRPAVSETAVRIVAPEPTEKSATRTQVNPSSPIVDAPAIGPKTAARFEAIGITTIDDLLANDAEQISTELNTKWITPRLISQWQAQARLACQIERLSAAGAGLLVMAGIESANDLSQRDATKVHSLLQSVAASPEGKRLLRDQGPPPLKTIQRWVEAARSNARALSQTR